MSMSVVRVVVAICGIVAMVSAASHSQVMDLYNNLILNYSSNIRPVLDQTKSVNVTVDIMLHSINLFDEVSGKLSMSGIFTFAWTDELLQWNPVSANGIYSMVFTSSHVWVPKVFLSNSVDEASIYKQSDSVEVIYSRDGRALLRTFKIFDVVCHAGILYYPNDVHTCEIEVAPLTSMDQINLTSSFGVIMKTYYPNLIWNVESTSVDYDYSGQHSKVEFYLTISRRPTFLLLTLVLPIIALNFMNLLVFLIPAESGEKISYAITVLLTFAVYLSVYSDKIPPLSLPIAVFSVSLLIKLCTSCLIALCCIVISKVIYHDEDRRVPFRMQQLTSCFLRNRKIGNMKKPSQKDSTTDVGTQSDEHEAGSLKRDDFLGRKVTWKEVADAMDKLCLVFFTVMSTVETVVSLTIIMNRH